MLDGALGPDEDRNDAGLSRLLARVIADRATRNGAGSGGRYALPESSPFKLTERERQVLVCLANGLDRQETAALLGVSPNTVADHLALSKRRLSAKTRAHAVAIAFRLGEIG